MTNSLYAEAIADAKALREAAEERAKQQLVKQMSPKIKLMVENAIMGEESFDSEEVRHEDPYSDVSDEETTVDSEFIEMPRDSKRDANEDLDMVDMSDDTFADSDEESASSVEIIDDADVKELNVESANILSKLSTKRVKYKALSEQLIKINENARKAKKLIQLSESYKLPKKNELEINKLVSILLKEVKLLRESNIIKTDKQLLESYLKLAQEINSMYKRRKSRLDESIEALLENEFLFEEDGEEEGSDDEPAEGGDDLDALLGDEPSSDEPSDDSDDEPAEEAPEGDDMPEGGDDELDLSDADPKAIKDALEALEAALGMPSDEPELEEESYMVDGDMLDGDMHDGDIHDEAMDEMDEAMDEMDENSYCEDDDDEKKKEGMHEGRDVYLDIDENMLRREISRMKNLREGRASRSENADAQKASRTNRKLVAEVAQYKKALNGMKGQLQEMNLFNAKLLYANKLMQNRNLTLSQQKKIVESLDGAKSLREAKILFEGIVNALNKQNKASKNLTEGTTRRILGESSRSTRSAQPANNRVEVDRWATLAGLR